MTTPPTGTVSILFNDIVGSTALMARVGDRRADEIRREFFDLMRRRISATGGYEVKTVGDGMMVAFSSAASAVQCATGMQRTLEWRNRTAEHPVSIRVGVSTGDATLEAGDYFGTAVVEAARLCDAAGSDGILVAESTKVTAGTRARGSFEIVGELVLKGLGGPVVAYRVPWQPRESSALGLPTSLQIGGRFQFVGREDEWSALAASWTAACAGSVRVVTLAGEPGAGKSRLAAEFARVAHDGGALVLHGRCDEDGGIAYQPFVQMLSSLLGRCSTDVLRDWLGRSGGELARLVPSIRDSFPDLAPPTQANPETERFRLLDAFSTLVASASLDAPTVAIVDDAHWATPPTLAMLRHLARVEVPASLLIIATYRDSDVSDGHPLAASLADLARQPGISSRRLEGIDEAAVRKLLESAAGGRLPENGLRFAARLTAHTQGNPLFIIEMLQHLVETGLLYRAGGQWQSRLDVDDLGVPATLRQTIGQRLNRLGDDSQRALRTAAVVGDEFDIGVVAAVCELAETEVLEHFEAAARSQILVEHGEIVDRFRFSHALVRATLYDSLSRARRTRMHNAIARAIEAHSGRSNASRLPELAHHFAAGAAVADRDKALDYGERAGDAASDAAAFEQAATHFRRSLDLIDGDESELRYRFLFKLGAALNASGDLEPAKSVLSQAARIAADAQWVQQEAAAAVEFGGPLSGWVSRWDDEGVTLLRNALAKLGDERTPIRAQLLAKLAGFLMLTNAYDERRALCREAVEVARSARDPLVLADVLFTHNMASWHPLEGDERVRNAAEVIEIGRSQNRISVMLSGYAAVLTELLELGRIDEYRDRREEFTQLIERMPPIWRWMAGAEEAGWAIARGEFAIADVIDAEALAIGQDHLGEPAMFPWFQHQLVVALLNGTLANWRDAVIYASEQDQALAAVWGSLLALIDAETGDTNRALTRLSELAADGFESIPRNALWLYAFGILGLACGRARAKDVAGVLYPIIEPHGGLVVQGAGFMVPLWSVSHGLGVLAATIGDLDAANDHFAKAHGVHRSMGARVYEALTEQEWGAVLLRRDGDGSPQARELLESARRSADELGLARISKDCATLLA